ncbi:MAG: glycoside hydrolase family 65 protein, partial [Polyangiaceae bacterium]|nr:glycoside hydrolase family 65 protein [Polyangiaceae bacterium]
MVPPAADGGPIAAKIPEELRHPFRLIALDWRLVTGGDCVAPVGALMGSLLSAGVRLAVFGGAALEEVVGALAGVRADARRRLFVALDQGAGLHGFNRRGEVIDLFVGVEDPGGAAGALIERVISPLRIGPHDVLVVGSAADAAGGAAALPGVRMLVEGGGAPAARALLDVLELQRGLDAEIGTFAAPRDAAWVIEEAGFDLAREHEIESLLSIANGYLGSRGSLAEGSSVSRPATFIAGAFEPSADVTRVPELVIAPDWGRIRFVIEGETFSVERDETLHHRRTLDMRRGVLLRDCTARSPAGHVTHLRTLHAASLADRHVLIEGVSVSPHNFTGTIRVDAILSGDVRSASGAAHWERFSPDVRAQSLSLTGRTRGGLVAAMTSHLRPADPSRPPPRSERTPGEISVAERAEIAVHIHEARELFRTVTLHTSRDALDPLAAGEGLRAALEARPAADILRDHERAWAERWRRAGVEIDGAPKIDRALRFALYHLIAAANPEDPRTSIGARALSGEAYRGHVFWDTEIFMLPFFTHCYPEAARAMLEYRGFTLPGARRNAAERGYEGALYAWESADTGDETTPSVVVTPFGEVLRVLSGEQEHHISADVAYAAWCYARATADHDFARGTGLEILAETARFWASRVETGPDGLAHIRKVIGPDEYHEEIDDNAFTNWMARHNLRTAAAAAARAPAEAARLGVGPRDIERWLEIADRIYLGLDPESGLIEQFAGYFQLEPFAIADYGLRTAPVDMLLGRARTQACQVVKQADVVQLVALLWDQLAPEARLANFLYYEERTAHGSSLSPGVHALVAARLGLEAHAARYFDQTADIDLGNNMGNAAGGVHAAGLGSLWQAVAFGAAGIRRSPDGDEEALAIEPHLPHGWRHVKVPFGWRGRALEIHVEPGVVEVEVIEGDRPLRVRLLDGGAARAVIAEPGRRY